MSDNVKLMQSFLNYCSDKGKVINQNIANVNTENYKRKNVDFGAYLESELTSQVKANEAKHMSTPENKVEVEETIFSEDRPVIIEEEMAELARNTINFKFMAKRVSGYYRNLQSVIKSGGQ